MKKIFTFVMVVAIAISASAASKANQELKLRVGTYNVWSHSARAWQIKKGATTESRNWDNSKKAVAELIESRFPKLNGKVLINYVGTTIGAHTGPGTVALFFWGDERID